MFRRKPKVLTPEQMEEIRTKNFFDMILPGNIKFFSDHYIIGDSYHSVWVIRESGKTIICLEPESEYEELADRGILHSGAASWKAWTHGKRPALYAVIFFTMDDVPLHYVLGRYNPDICEKHYGKRCWGKCTKRLYPLMVVIIWKGTSMSLWNCLLSSGEGMRDMSRLAL